MRVNLRALLLIGVAAGGVMACGPHRIAGTNIIDNSETRAILDVIERYRVAMEQRNADLIIQLTAPNFRDSAGTTTHEDDMDAQTLPEKLPARLAKLDDVHLELQIRKIEAKGDVADVVYNYTVNFRMPSFGNKPQSEIGIKQMSLERLRGKWKIVSGI